MKLVASLVALSIAASNYRELLAAGVDLQCRQETKAHLIVKVEEEMLMRKFYEIMSAHGKVKRIEYDSNVCGDDNNGDSSALAVAICNDEQ